MKGLLLMSIIFLSACTSRFANSTLSTKSNCLGNAYSERKYLNGFAIQLAFLTPEELISRDLEKINSPSKKERRESIKAYSQNYYFLLSISRNDREVTENIIDPRLYSLFLNTISFNASPIVTLKHKNDSIELIDQHAPRFFGYSASTEILLVFGPCIPNVKDLVFTLHESGLGTGNVDFHFNIKSKSKNIH
jgi:hypothetical protein